MKKIAFILFVLAFELLPAQLPVLELHTNPIFDNPQIVYLSDFDFRGQGVSEYLFELQIQYSGTENLEFCRL